MKVIIPLAGKGTRLRPHTHITPKPMLKVAGKPVMAVHPRGPRDARQRRADHLHHRASQGEGRGVRAHEVRRSRRCSSSRRCRTARRAPSRSRATYVDQPVLIIFVDTIFDADLSVMKTTDADGIIWVKEVEDYQRFGVVVTDADGNMTKIVEKPNDADLEAREHRPLLHQELEAAVRGHRPRAQAAEEQGRVLPHRRVPVHDRQGREDQGRSTSRAGTTRARSTRCSRRTASMLEKGARAPAEAATAARRSSIRSTSRTTSCSRARAIGPERVDRTRLGHREVGAQGHARRVEHEDRRLDARELAHRRLGDHRGREGRADAERPLGGSVAASVTGRLRNRRRIGLARTIRRIVRVAPRLRTGQVTPRSRSKP